MKKLINEHLNKTETSLKKAPFWKYATIATVCIEQEYAVYETLAKGCAYDMSKFLGKVIKRYWQAIPTGYSIDESFLLALVKGENEIFASSADLRTDDAQSASPDSKNIKFVRTVGS